MTKDMDRYTKKYIRNRDLKHFKKSEYGMYKGVLLTKYYGTLKKASDKGIPVYNKMTEESKIYWFGTL